MTISNTDQTSSLREQLLNAIDNNSPLSIKGNGSKNFYGNPVNGSTLDLSSHSGIISFEPSELVITARAGTPLSDIQSLLNDNKQLLAFEPPMFNNMGTLGGAVASGLSGPRRPWVGAARDFVLGVKILNGKGEELSFGGQVMKNVAGYDVARLMTGSLGTLGVLLEISLKVLPRDEHEVTLVSETDTTTALSIMTDLNGQTLPVSAMCYLDGKIYIRLSATKSAVEQACRTLDGEELDDADEFWVALRDQTATFFTDTRPLWRLSLPPATIPLQIQGDTLIDWGGGQRWLSSDEDAGVIRQLCDAHGGHATLFRSNGCDSDRFHPLAAGLAGLHRQIKHAFDPANILNPGRMVRDW